MKSVRWSAVAVILLTIIGLSGCLDIDKAPDPNIQLAADIETIDQYLVAHGISAIKDQSGIRFHIETIGTKGFPPTQQQTVTVDYVGKFLSGTEFASGVDQSGPVNGFIGGWQLALAVWPAGTKGTVYIPSPLGYGNENVGVIPANTILVYDITLKEVIPSNAEKVRLVNDIATIDQYLETNSIAHVKDTTGVRYVITNEGTAPVPTWYSKVKFTYKGKVLANGALFFDGLGEPVEGFDSRMVDYIDGIKVGLSKIGVGGKITVYVPSGLGFGATGSTQSPVEPNSNLTYDIEILQVTN